MSGNPYDQFMGFEVSTRAPGDVTVAADVDARHHNPAGVLHGGVLAGMLDSTMGNSMFSLLEPGQSTTNMEFHVRFLRSTTAGRITAEAKIIKRGRQAIVWEASVHNDAGKEVARATSTFLILTSPE